MENYTDNFSEQEVKDMIYQYYNEFEVKEVGVSAIHGKVVTSKKYLPHQNVVTYSVSEKVINEEGMAVERRTFLTDDYLKKILNSLLNEKGIFISEIDYNSNGIAVSGKKSITEDRSL